ncbi:protein LSM12 homolog A-like [Diorhabda sublineata]|uniref:protein LSM12 homolog A-like n=1 Tax=Diorhabda sublineata TaxID=1163346 RepID=UPI0024E1394C|nr:protein LSM12 homolog A-like [Diorhabda sublineata]
MAAVSDFFSLGSIVWCRTCYNKEIEGEVLAFDPPTKVLILKCTSSGGDPKLNDIHFVNLSLVSELQVKKEVTSVPDIPQSLNLQRLNTRIRNQVDEKKRMFQARAANVSSEGQSLFIAIAKTISEVRWNNSEIVVFNQDVTISPPYQLENIRGNINSKEYIYIRKVVEKHMKDLALNSQNQGVCQNNTLQ